MSSLASIRLNSFSDNIISETDTDVTALLTELDKGLLSIKDSLSEYHSNSLF